MYDFFKCIYVYCVVGIDPDSGLKTGVSDPRKDGRPAAVNPINSCSSSSSDTNCNGDDASTSVDDDTGVDDTPPGGDGR
jgi:hypothetical protein